ncbi:hypothetical protein NBRC116594_37610 [Shimia sp. NS0008-38b]|uniref:hypothetical protein n=1 Tax=Shimia sp. NS0008-38b TaxID=3127653 RepID=UPI003107125C
MNRTKHLIFAAIIGLSAGAASAEEAGDGQSLMERGLTLFFEGLQEEMAPTVESLNSLMEEIGPGVQGFLEDMGPRLGAVFSKVEDWSQYHAPEMLDNGDIILRKKTPEDIEILDEGTEGGGIEL